MRLYRGLLVVLLCLLAGSGHSPAQEPVPLSIAPLRPQSLRLSWTNAAAGFVLEQTPTLLLNPFWTLVPAEPTDQNGNFQVLLGLDAASQFFRLRFAPTEVVPPDPVHVAPPPVKGVTTLLTDSTSFLYSGTNPIQTGVVPGTIQVKRAAVIRGKVKNRDGSALPGIRIAILDHAEFGSTLSRADGTFDLAVNGGGPLTIDYERTGFCPVHRQVKVPWQDYLNVPDVVMVPMDPVSTAVTFGANSTFQVAESSMQSDTEGARHTLILFSPGTGAGLVMADGSTQAVSFLHIRATEFTVGTNGAAAMPSLLPPLSGYTYCVELSADEAMSAGATGVVFDQPVVTYVENFLGFPVGSGVPAGIYDRAKAVWVPAVNGLVVKIVGITGGLADVDTDGDGLPDSGLNLTTDERRALASAYPAGQSLWRVPVAHFSPEDSNWPFTTPPDAVSPANNGAGPDPNEPLEHPCESHGTIIECENQVLGDSVGIAGTHFSLNYRSDRVPGRVATRDIHLSGSSVPASLASIGLHMSVAGRSFDQAFPASPNQQTTFAWDRLDAYGRQVLGGQTLDITIDYNYPTTYATPGPFPSAFNQPGGATLSANPGRQQISVSDHFTATIGEGLTDARTLGLGGWTLSGHNVYDPNARVMHGGNGSRLRAGSLARTMTTIDMPGRSVLFDVAVGPDGSAYIALPHGDWVVRLGPDGSQTIVAGNGTEGFGGDGGAATNANLGDPVGVAVAADGSLYIGEESNWRVRKVSPDGIITTVAGNGVAGFGGDGGPATQASFARPERVAVGADSSLYIVDGGVRIRRVTGDGIIHTVAGNGSAGFSGDGGAATSASLNCFAVAVAPDGSFYIADFENNRVRRVGPDGIIRTVADYTSQQGLPVAVNLSPTGRLLIALLFNGGRTPQVDVLEPDGSLITVAGGGNSPIQQGTPATQATLDSVSGVAFAPDGSFFVAPGGSGSRVLHIGAALPGVEGSEFLVASSDGTQLFRFGLDGRHLETLDAMTGASLLSFGYDANGMLTQVIEVTGGSNNVTTIEHDSGGHPTAIVSPFGLVTLLAVDTNGFLASITNPGGGQQQFAYSSGGLLTGYVNPLGKTSTFAYDSLGLLIKDTDPSGAAQTLQRAVTPSTFTVTRATALNRVTSYKVENLSGNVQRRTVTAPDGTQQQSTETIDAGMTHATSSDGTISDTTLGPDPRFGMEAPFTTSSTLSFPSGLALKVTTARSAILADPSDPLSLKSSSQTTAMNGQTNTLTYTAVDRSLVATSPLGRSLKVSFDAVGRITQMSAPGIESASSIYDNRGRLAAVVDGAGASARTNTFAYSPQGFLQTVTDPIGRNVQYSYDAAGRPTQKVFPDGEVVAYGYDAAGNLTSLTPPGRPPYSLSYDDRNELASITPPAVTGSGPITYTRDADEALTSVSRPGGQTITLGRDSAGRAASRRLSTDGVTNSTVVFNYDPATGKLSGVNGPGGIGISYAYDGSLLISETCSGPAAGAVTRTYDGFLRVATESVSGDTPIAFGYDADGLLTTAGNLAISRNLANGLPTNSTLGAISDARTLDSSGRTLAYHALAGATALYDVAYTRDALNRLKQKVETVAGATTTLVYTYDLGGRLTDVTANGIAAEHYEYDVNGNRTSATVRGTSATATYDPQDRLLQDGNATFAYNGAGEVVGKTNGAQTTNYQRDEVGNLLGVTLPDGTAITYLVDGLDRRVGKRVNGSLVKGFLYGRHIGPVAELDGTGAVVSRFVYADGLVPAYLVKGGVAYGLITDQVGSVRLVVNSTTGAIVQRLEYDAFGNVLTDTNPGFQPFGFAGGLYDPDTRLVQFGARDYDAETGRWTSKDPLWFAGFDANLYRYARSDPVNSFDPSGFGPLDRGLSFSETVDASVQDPWDFWGGVFEGALDMVVASGGFYAAPYLGPLPAMIYVNNHPVLDTVQAAFDSDLVDTQSSVFKFGKALPTLCLGNIAGEAGAVTEGAGAMESEATQIVRVRDVPVRPFARDPIQIISAGDAQQNIGKFIDALFEEFPGGGPPK